MTMIPNNNDQDSGLSVGLHIQSEKGKKHILSIEFVNQGVSSVYIDKKELVYQGEYTKACLKLFSGEQKVRRVINMKLKPSNFPEDYFELKSKSRYLSKLVLNDTFVLPDTGEVSVQYKCHSKDPSSGIKRLLESTTIYFSI